jgi:hypothetical protein
VIAIQPLHASSRTITLAIHKAGSRRFLWESGKLIWKLHSTQRIIHDTIKSSTADEILILSCRQLGKSYWAVCYAIEYCLQNPNSIVRFVAPTLKQVQDIVSDNLAIIIRDAPEGLIVRQKSDYRYQIGTSSLRMGSLERAHVDGNRGTRADLVILEEGGFTSSADYEYAIKSVLGPQVLRAKGRLIHVTTPSEELEHILHTEIKAKTELNGAFFSYTIYDNPQLTQEHIDKAIALCGGENTTAWKREYLAQIIRNEETVVIPPFTRAAHVKPITLPEHCYLQVAIDWGGVRDKTVALLHTYDFKRNKKLWLAERVFDPNTATDVIVKSLREMEGEAEVIRYADVPGQLQVDLSHTHKYDIQLPVKDDWRAGVNSLQVSFAQNQHEIDPGCKFLIQSLETGRFNKNRTDFDRSPVLGHCDAIAAMMYGNRMMSESNPYPYIQPSLENHLVIRKPKPEMQELAEAIQPKSFANDFDSSYFTQKKFGTFKR